MCRIFGKFGDLQAEDPFLSRAALAMKHGGPDRQHYKSGAAWALGTNRLAIQGIKGGDQPFTQNGLCVAFNGEIYNHHVLRRDLEKRGFSFSDECDGNVIAPLFLVYGPACVSYMDGMFAIAIVDMRQRPSLHLFSDPMAIKSVYYHWNDKEKIFSFASEIEALALLTQQPLEVKPKKIYDYLSLRSICSEDTIFRNVYTLGPSRYLQCPIGEEPQLSTYSSHIKVDPPAGDLAASGQELQNLLTTEIAQMMNADVPVCVVTSGGLDSTLISALASKKCSPLHSFHVCYKGDWPLDEREYARAAARQFGTIHHEIAVDPNTFPDLLQRMTTHIGQPNTAPHNLSTYCLFSGIHEAGFRVALTGEGSDEMFAGYDRFAFSMTPGNDWIPSYMDKFGPFPAALREDILSANYKQTLSYKDTRIEQLTAMVRKTAPGVERLDALQALDQGERFPYYILRRVDHLSMAHAVEVRVPFCQPRIVDFARQLPADQRLSCGKSKRVVYAAAEGLVPETVLTRKKQPFTLPITAMMRPGTKLFDFVESVLRSKVFMDREYFRSSGVHSYLDRQASLPDDGIANMLWSVMGLELWFRHIDKLNASLFLDDSEDYQPMVVNQRRRY